MEYKELRQTNIKFSCKYLWMQVLYETHNFHWIGRAMSMLFDSAVIIIELKNHRKYYSSWILYL